MPEKEVLLIIAGLLFIVGFGPYIRAILRKETKPVKASWIIWASLDYIVLAGMIAANSVNGQIIGAIVGASTVMCLAMKFGTPGWTKTDKWCLGGAVLGVALWFVFSSPILGIMVSCVVGFLGSIPTFISAWNNPDHENKLAWTIFWLSCVCALFAVPHWTLEDAAQPVTFSAVETIMMYILYIHSRPRVRV